MLSLGWGAIVEAWLDSLPQSFPRLRITLVAARHAQPADKGARVVTVGTRRYVLDPANRLELTEVDLRRVRLTSHGAPAGQTVLVIRLRRASANTLRDRSLRALRGGPFGWSCDAIYVNGQLVMVPIYREVIADGRLQITDNDRRSLERLHTILTGKSSR